MKKKAKEKSATRNFVAKGLLTLSVFFEDEFALFIFVFVLASSAVFTAFPLVLRLNG